MKPAQRQKIALTEWAENQLSSKFDPAEVFIKDASWNPPPEGRALVCKSFLPVVCPYGKGHGIKKRLNLTETIIMVGDDNSVRLNCQHGSCAKSVARLNAEIRANQWSAYYDRQIEMAPPIRTEEQIKAERDRQERARQAKNDVAKIAAKPLPLSELSASSPVSVSGLTPEEMMTAHLGLFDPNDLLWVAADPTRVFSTSFRKTKEWISQLPSASVFLSGSTYKDPFGSRRTANLDQTRFCVFEHDRFGKETTAAIFRHAEAQGMPLVAVVDSGGKSVHGWCLADENLLRWREFFLAAGFDSKAMRPTQPVRLAGGKRVEEDKPTAIQKLLYLNLGAVPWKS